MNNLSMDIKPSSTQASGISGAPGIAKLIESTSSLNSTFMKWSKYRIISARHLGLRTGSAYLPRRFRTASSKARFRKTDPHASAVPMEHSLIMNGFTDSTSYAMRSTVPPPASHTTCEFGRRTLHLPRNFDPILKSTSSQIVAQYNAAASGSVTNVTLPLKPASLAAR